LSFIQAYTGQARYYPDWSDNGRRLLVAIAFRVEGLAPPLHGLLDTGSHWCLLPASLAAQLGCELEPDPDEVPVQTRYGPLRGRLERLLIYLLAEEGETLDLQATFFITADWPGPPVIGWKGCLERISFAFANGRDENRFCFTRPE
jgi:hypothetical protein